MADEQSGTFPHISRPRRISWLTIVLALLAVGTFIAISNSDGRYYPVPMMGSIEDDFRVSPAMMEGDGGSYDRAVSVQSGMMAPDYYYSPNVPANDTRELLKTSYGAEMRTRDVQGLTRRVETTVRGHSGRIDQMSSAEKYGYVSFVVPVSKYETFRTELESLVGSRFLTVDIQSQNMLPQKQSIEEQQKQADETLAEYKADRQRLVSAHATTVRSIQTRIDADTQELANLRALPPTYDIQVQIQQVSDNLALLKRQLANENASYSAQLSNADSNIEYAEEWQEAVKKQDTALMDDVATVNGSVSISWISLWEMAQVYLPGYWIPAIFAMLTILSFLWDRRRFGTA